MDRKSSVSEKINEKKSKIGKLEERKAKLQNEISDLELELRVETLSDRLKSDEIAELRALFRAHKASRGSEQELSDSIKTSLVSRLDAFGG